MLASSREPTVIVPSSDESITPKTTAQKAVVFGVPDWIRTNGTKRRRLVLYPAELRIRFVTIFYYF